MAGVMTRDTMTSLACEFCAVTDCAECVLLAADADDIDIEDRVIEILLEA
jgi:hypothetical protein